jgi:hypothetical protein
LAGQGKTFERRYRETGALADLPQREYLIFSAFWSIFQLHRNNKLLTLRCLSLRF